MPGVRAISDYQIERGKPTPSKNHAFVQKRLLLQLEARYADRFEVLPELSLDLPVRDRVPDLAIYQKQQIAFTPGDDDILVFEVPLCMIEIISLTQSLAEFHQKRREYFKAGAKSYWLVLPDLLTVYVYYDPENYDIFTRQNKLIDRQLNIEVDLADVFR